MKAVFTRFFSMLMANTPPSKKRYSSRNFLSLFLILFLAVGNAWADTQTYSFASSEELSNFTYTAGDGSDSWAVYTAKQQNVSVRDGGFVQYKCGKSGRIATFVTTSSFENISNISFYIASSDKGKTQVKIEVSSKADFSSDVTEIVNATGGLSGLGISSPSNNTWYSVSKSFASKSGYVRFTMTSSSSGKYWSFDDIVITYTPSSGGDPVCPSGLSITSKNDKTAFYTGDAIELTAALSEGNGAITYQWYKGGTAEGNKLAGKTAAKLEIASCVEGDAGDYYCVASKSDCSDAVNADAFTITVTHNPCATYFWFFNDADQTANGKTNATSVFSNMASGGSNLSGSITIDETTYNVTRRTGDTDPLGGFTVPANKAATFYALAVSSGDGARKIVLTNTTTSATYEADVAGGNTSYKRVQIDNIAPGTYSIGKSGGNTRLGMVALKVCDAIFHTIAFDSDGGSSVADLSVLDGTTAIQPTDPTWAHHRFDGWYNGETFYDWTANVTGDLTLTAHWTQLYTITYAAGDGTATGDAPTQVDKAEGETFTVAANTFEVAGKDFVKWNDGTKDYNPGATYTMGSADVTLTAQWKAAADKYTVIFKDGTTELGTKLFDVTTNPSDADIDKTKALNTFAAWQKEGVDIALDDAFWATVAKDDEITLTARWTPKYATSLDFAAITTDGTTGDNPIVDFLASGNMIASNLGGESGWETSTSKSGYVGYKLKNTGATITFLVQGGKRVMITFGSIGANVTLKKGEESVTISAASGDNAETVYPAFDVATDMLITLTTTSGSTVTLKSITIGEIPDISGDATLKDLKVNGTTIAGFNSATKIYYLTVPYGTEVANMPKITEATANHASAAAVIYPDEGPEWTEEYGGCYLQQVVVTAADGITKGYYHVRTTVDAKQGVSLIKATHTGATTADVTGYIGGSVDKNTQGGGKLGGTDQYFGIKLAEGTFLAGDVVKIYASAVSAKVQIFSDKGTTMINEGEFDGNYYTYTLTKATEWIYLYRTSEGGSNMNPTLGYIEVQRDMAPFIESFVIGEAEGTIDQANKTIALEVAASADLTALTPTIVAWANGGATVTPTGAQDFTNPVTYFVASAYAEDYTTEYTVTVTQAVPSADATLKTLTINGNALTLVDGVYEYDYELPYGTTAAPTVEVEKNDANATAVVTSVSLTEAVITVTAENGATQEYVINFTISPWQNIVIWDGSTMDAVAASPDASGLTWEVNDFGSITKYTTTCGSKTYSKVLPSGGSASDSRNFKIVIPDGYLAKFYIAFASHSEGTSRGMSIGTTINKNSDTSIYGAECSTRSEALGGTSVIVGAGTYYINPLASIDFCEVSVLLRPGYIRTGLTVGTLGTICLPSNVPAGHAFGATFYELVGKEPQYGKIVFDEILSGELVAGKPYLFQAQSDVLYCFYGTENVTTPDNSGAMKGTFEDITLTNLTNIYYFAQKALWSCVDLTSLSVPANRAYVQMDEMPAYTESNPAPGVRRITLGVNGQQVATGVDQVQGDEVPTKMIINGQLFILRGEKMYDAQGKLVK